MEQMKDDIALLQATQAGMIAILNALIATHPNYRQLQLQMTTRLEGMLAGGFGATLTDAQKEVVREFVEWLQQTAQAPGEIDPISLLLGRRTD